MRYQYYLGDRLVCESTAKVVFTKDYPAMREVEVAVQGTKDDKKKNEKEKEKEPKEAR